MVICLSDAIRVSFEKHGALRTLVFPSYEEMAPDIKKLVTTRIRGKGMRMKLDPGPAREQFVDSTARDIEATTYMAGAKNGKEEKPLSSTVKGWLGKVPIDWKYTAAPYFEEPPVEVEDTPLGANVRVRLDLIACEVVLIFRPDDQIDEAVKELNKPNIGRRGRQSRSAQHVRRERFIAKTLVGTELIVSRDASGKENPIPNEGDKWFEKIPYNWRSAGASAFEEDNVLGDEEGNA